MLVVSAQRRQVNGNAVLWGLMAPLVFVTSWKYFEFELFLYGWRRHTSGDFKSQMMRVGRIFPHICIEGILFSLLGCEGFVLANYSTRLSLSALVSDEAEYADNCVFWWISAKWRWRLGGSGNSSESNNLVAWELKELDGHDCPSRVRAVNFSPIAVLLVQNSTSSERAEIQSAK